MTGAPLIGFHTLWVGRRLGPLSVACLSSFVAMGHGVTVHVYDEAPEDLPPGVALSDASLVAPRERIMLHRKHQSVALFSDLFRLMLQAKGVGPWIDCDILCVRPDIHGQEAAAVATIKRIVRSGKVAVPPLDLDHLTAPEPSTKQAKPRSTEQAADREDSPEAPAGTTQLRTPKFQSSYAACLRRITSAKRDLFLDDTPDLDRCRQGPLGNCFLVASVGALVSRDPATIKSLITTKEGGGYDIHFGDGQSVSVSALTDAELAISGTTGDEGLWLPVLEKAVGSLRMQEDPEKYPLESPTDAIAHGGSTATIVKLLTGHQTERITLKRRPKVDEANAPKGPDGKPIAPEPVPAADPAELAARVRTAVNKALNSYRLVTASTGTEKQPPGISPKHAYAVIAYDPTIDSLIVWNPHGNTFNPKGDPGIDAGYKTRRGVFTLPVTDFIRIFRGVVLETDQPVEPTKPAASTR